jgi:hypothetical protein
MTANMYDFTQGFVSKFKRVRELCEGSPDTLDRLCERDASARALVDSLFTDAYILDRAFGKSPQLYVPQVHEDFPIVWGEYGTIWSTAVWSARLLVSLDDLDGPSSTPEEEDEQDTIESSNGQADIYIEDFDPQWHVLSEAITNMIQYCRDKIAYVDAPEAVAVLQLGVTAWDFLESMGFDTKQISSRYARTPKVYIPKHVSDSHGTTERRSLLRLLDETGRAYYFGAPLAALSMCRSILELLLSRYYVPRHASAPLSKMIRAAEDQYPWLCQENLATKAEAANDVLHEMMKQERLRTLPENVEQEVQNFMLALKKLIERAPKPIGTGPRGVVLG